MGDNFGCYFLIIIGAGPLRAIVVVVVGIQIAKGPTIEAVHEAPTVGLEGVVAVVAGETTFLDVRSEHPALDAVGKAIVVVDFVVEIVDFVFGAFYRWERSVRGGIG